MLRSAGSESTRYMPRGLVVLPSFGRTVDAHAIEWNQKLGWRQG
ncbi:hypothetical protein [Micromonospora sp. C51]|nr:hypothetical protein [Micromonospora sp. C51]